MSFLKKEIKDEEDRDRQNVLSAAVSVAELVLKANVNSTLQAIIDIEPNQWRARYIRYLGRRIDEARLELLRAPSMSPVLREARIRAIDLWTRKEAEALGANELAEREIMLRRFLALATAERPDAVRRVAASQEITAARAELDDVQKKLSDRRTSIFEAAKPPEKDAVIGTFKNVRRLTESEVQQVNEKGWEAAMRNEAAPKYVIVLEEEK